MTLALSPQSQLAMKFANSFGVYGYRPTEGRLPEHEVMSAPQYGQKTATNSQGYSPIGNAFQIIVDKIDNQKVAYPAFNEKLRAHKLIPEPSSWKQKNDVRHLGHDRPHADRHRRNDRRLIEAVPFPGKIVYDEPSGPLRPRSRASRKRKWQCHRQTEARSPRATATG